jgi:hypothetical protein
VSNQRREIEAADKHRPAVGAIRMLDHGTYDGILDFAVTTGSRGFCHPNWCVAGEQWRCPQP